MISSLANEYMSKTSPAWAPSTPPVAFIRFIHWVWLVLGLVFCIQSDRKHDYWSYIEQWRLVLAGLNPWGPLSPEFGVNTYGPLQNVLGLFLPIDLLAPKMVIFLVFAVASTMLLDRLLRERGDDWRALILYFLAVPGNMLVTAFSFAFGSNDLLVASFVIFAILGRLDGKSIFPGFWLALAILLKLYPVLLVPLFVVNRGKIDLRLAMATVGFFLLGMLASYLVWGNDVLIPFRFASERGASFLSPFVPLTRIDRAITGGAIVEPLLRFNSLLVLLVAIVSALYVWARGFAWLTSLIIVFMAALITYKVGHQQFFTPWICAIGCLPLLHSQEADHVGYAAMPYLLFLSGFSLVHVFQDGIIFDRVPLWSMIAFSFAVMTLIRLMRVRTDSTARPSFHFGRGKD